MFFFQNVSNAGAKGLRLRGHAFKETSRADLLAIIMRRFQHEPDAPLGLADPEHGRDHCAVAVPPKNTSAHIQGVQK